MTKGVTTDRETTLKKSAIVDESVGRYNNPLSNFGFKYIIGTKEFYCFSLKDAMTIVLFFVTYMILSGCDENK